MLTIFENENTPLNSISCIFCSDDFLLNINNEYLGHDYYTDIITFSLEEKGLPVEAELYISITRVKENAKENEVSFFHELIRVIFHGCLHLCGYNDGTLAEIKEIRAKEDFYISTFLATLQ